MCARVCVFVVGGWYTVTVQFWKSIRQPSPEAEIWWLWVWRGEREGGGAHLCFFSSVKLVTSGGVWGQ